MQYGHWGVSANRACYYVHEKFFTRFRATDHQRGGKIVGFGGRVLLTKGCQLYQIQLNTGEVGKGFDSLWLVPGERRESRRVDRVVVVKGIWMLWHFISLVSAYAVAARPRTLLDAGSRSGPGTVHAEHCGVV